jgi:hypothetical protein
MMGLGCRHQRAQKHAMKVGVDQSQDVSENCAVKDPVPRIAHDFDQRATRFFGHNGVQFGSA